MSAIPAESRTVVRLRAHQRCERCLVPAPNGEWHHRRSRSVVDEHTHCPCNGVWLCHTCHRDVHAHPTQAMATGWIVSRWIDEPATVPIRRAANWFHDCVGGVRYG